MSGELIVKEYLGNGIEFKVINGMVYANATSFGESQKLANWKRSEKTKELLERKYGYASIENIAKECKKTIPEIEKIARRVRSK